MRGVVCSALNMIEPAASSLSGPPHAIRRTTQGT